MLAAFLFVSAAFADIATPIPVAECPPCPEGQEQRSVGPVSDARNELEAAGWSYWCTQGDSVHYCRGPGAKAVDAGALVGAGAQSSGWICATIGWSPAAGALLLAAAGIRRRRA